MNLTVQQMRSLANLIESAETMVELYWDTDNGQKLSRSLKSVRVAFDDLAIGKPDPLNNRHPRVIIEAQCSTCGPLDNDHADGVLAVRLAMEHSAALGHVVILNGTTDLPGDDDHPSTVGPPSHHSNGSVAA